MQLVWNFRREILLASLKAGEGEGGIVRALVIPAQLAKSYMPPKHLPRSYRSSSFLVKEVHLYESL